MRTSKIILSSIIFLLVLVLAVRLALGGDVSICTLHLCFALYIFIVAASSVYRQTAPLHSASVWHLTSLTMLAVALIGFTSILPSENLPVIAAQDSTLPSLWYASLVLYTVAFVTALNIPCGPGLHYPPAAIYSEKTALAITNKEENNVSGVNGNKTILIPLRSRSFL
jgi:hypothetical protein